MSQTFNPPNTASGGSVSPFGSAPGRSSRFSRNQAKSAWLVFLGLLLLMVSPVSALMPAPDLRFLQVTPSRIPTGKPVKVTVTLRIPVPVLNENGPPAVLTLHRLDASANTPVAKLAVFYDDGRQGDEVAGDGLYTAQTMLTAQKATTIALAAIATFQNPDVEPLSSLQAFIEAKSGASLAGPWAVVEGQRVVFRNKDGSTISEEKASDMAAKKTATAAALPGVPLFKFDHAVTSPDQTHVGIIGSLQQISQNASAPKETQALSGWEFRYQDYSGILWTKTTTNPERYFFIPRGPTLISEDGSRVVLLEVEDVVNKNPVLWVYNQSGAILLEEKVDLLSVDDALISRNGRYLLLKGWIEIPTGGVWEKLIVIDLDSPTVRWSEPYRQPGESITSAGIYENQAGGFDVVLNGITRYSFPR